jgi:hypothetical protein
MAYPIAGQESKPRTLRQKLDQETQFKPKAGTALDQLIDVAKNFEIPMGIEWNESTTCNALATPVLTETVRGLLNDILRRCPGHRLAVERGIVHVYSRFTRHPNNILNLRLWGFRVKDGNVVDANFELRLAIDMELHPEEYKGGWNGGYGGYPSDEALAVPNITFSGRNLTVRNVLDGVIKSSGNALWVVRLKAATLNRRASLAKIYKEYDEIINIWEFFSLKNTRKP